MSNYDPAAYKPETCNSSVPVYGIYLCRLNGGVPCALHKGKMCYAEKVDRATNELIKAMKEKEKMMGKWIVTQDYIRGELCYMVENSVTGERKGTFDWQARAQEFADELNKEEENGNHSSLLFRAVPQERS